MLPLRSDAAPADGLRLGRAAYAYRLGDPHDVIDLLAGLEDGPEPRYAGADRAAFLLGQAYLRSGSVARFTRPMLESALSWVRAQRGRSSIC